MSDDSIELATVEASIKLLAKYVGLDMACKMIFLEIRPKLVDKEVVMVADDIRNKLEKGGTKLETMNEEYMREKASLKGNKDYIPRTWNAVGPKAWRAPSWEEESGEQGVDNKFHNFTMNALSAKVLQDFETRYSQPLEIGPAKAYLVGMAAQAVDNAFNNDTNIYFDGQRP